MLGSISLSQLPNLLSLFPVTENSGFLLLNNSGERVFQSENLKDVKVPESLVVPDSATTQLNIGGQQYLCSAEELEWGLKLVFLTPYGDITQQIWKMMSPYLLCSIIFLA